MLLSIYQIDAFAEKQFEGNPAAVIPLENWLPDSTMQSIAEENNLAETAFFVPTTNGYHIRWFTPTTEVKLCGHATLASAYVLFNIMKIPQKTIEFQSLSGILNVSQTGDLLSLDFPTQAATPCITPEILIQALGHTPSECLKSQDYIAVFPEEVDITNIKPDFELLKKLDLRAVIITSTSTEFDFINRVFAPNFGILEDPVTGSSYTCLAPYWANKLGKNILEAKQVSPRGGRVLCELKADRTLISGRARVYLKGEVNLDF